MGNLTNGAVVTPTPGLLPVRPQLPEAMMAYCQLERWEHLLWEHLLCFKCVSLNQNGYTCPIWSL